VYRGFYRGHEVAIKQLKEDALAGGSLAPQQLQELRKELNALRKLKHPRLIHFFGACLQVPTVCLVMEFMAGGSLYNLLHVTKFALARRDQFRIALQTNEGLIFLHGFAPPVVHRDLKTMNVLLDRSLHVKLCDFGLTQPLDSTHMNRNPDGESGSPRYMAPEMYDAGGKLTEKVDIWAMGCVWIEIFGGPLPHLECQTIQQIMTKLIVQRQGPTLPPVPERLRGAIAQCLSFSSHTRASAQEAYRSLKDSEAYG